jgi:hypothetical protein
VSRTRVPRIVGEWINNRTPGAAVRFGEGEGRLLTATESDPTSIKVAVRKLRRQTGLTIPRKDVLAIRALTMQAFDGADIIGVRGSPSFSEEHLMWVRRLEALLDERTGHHRRGSAYVSHSLFNNNLRDELPALLRGQDRISVISSRDVKPVIQRDLPVADVRVYQVPSQFVMRRVDGPYEATLHDVPIWPDFYRDIQSAITVRQEAEIFLIGAGILGKYLCIRVKELGGIALDMGSTLDGLAGKTTRGPGRPEPFTL